MTGQRGGPRGQSQMSSISATASAIAPSSAAIACRIRRLSSLRPRRSARGQRLSFQRFRGAGDAAGPHGQRGASKLMRDRRLQFERCRGRVGQLLEK